MPWHGLKVHERVTLLRWALPALIFVFALIYQLAFAQWLHETIGRLSHYVSEILFYGVFGPIVMYLALTWVARGLAEKERAEALVRERDRLLASITSTSAEAILSLDTRWLIRSWNRGRT